MTENASVHGQNQPVAKRSIFGRISQFVVRIPENTSTQQLRPARLLAWLLFAMTILVAFALVVVLIANQANGTRREVYLLLMVVFFLLLGSAYLINRWGNYQAAAIITVASAVAAPWFSFLFDKEVLRGDFMPLVYVTLPIFLSSLLLSLRQTGLVALLQIAFLAVLPFVVSVDKVFNWPSLVTFVFFVSILVIVSGHIRLVDLQQIQSQTNALRESEIRFRALADHAPVLIWMSGEDTLCNYFNKSWLDFTGRTLKQEMGNGWAASVHPDDLPACLDVYLNSFATRRPFVMEYRLRHHSGGYHWIVNHGVPRFGPDQAFLGYIGSCVDITLQKTTEKALESHIARLKAFYTIAQAMVTSMSPDLFYPLLVHEICAHLQVDAASILLMDKVTHTLNFAAGFGFYTNALKYTRIEIGAGLAGRAAQERKTIYVSDLAAMEENPALKASIQSESFVIYYGVPLIVKDQLRGVLEVFHRSQLEATEDWLSFLETLAGQAAISIDSAILFSELQTSNSELGLAYDTTLEGWSRALDLRDKETEGHTQRVTDLSVRLGQFLNFPDEIVLQIKRGALLHDIGKMGISDNILLKPGPLSPDEWLVMKKHPVYAYELLSPIQYLQPALAIPYCHHERYDGSGYPRGLKGEQIPLQARVFSVVDVWDALTSDRPYRPAWSKEKALLYILEKSGSEFDPLVVTAFEALVRLDELAAPVG